MEAKPYKIPHPFRKLKKTLIDTIVQDIAEGSTKKHSCLANGITPRVFEMWVQQGFVDLDHDIEDSLFVYLVRSLNKVRQKEIKECRKLIKKGRFGHKGAEWTLEHAFWQDFSSKVADLDFERRLSALEDKQNPDQLEEVKDNGNINLGTP